MSDRCEKPEHAGISGVCGCQAEEIKTLPSVPWLESNGPDLIGWLKRLFKSD